MNESNDLKELKELKELKVAQCYILLENLKSGINNIKKCLSKYQLNQLLKQGELKEFQKKNFKSDIFEGGGNFALMTNTFFTCIAGGWLGAAGFMQVETGVRKLISFIVTIVIASMISGYFGYKHYKKIKDDAKLAIDKQKILNLQLKVIDLIILKQKRHTKKIINYLNNSLKKLDAEFEYCYDKNKEVKEFYNFLDRLLTNTIKELNNDDASEIYIDELLKIKNSLSKFINRNVEVKLAENKDKVGKNVAASSHIIEEDKLKSLTEKKIVFPREKVTIKLWLKRNLRGLLIGLIPTVTGSFGSFFVYFSGIPGIAKEFGIASLSNYINEGKFVVIVVLTLITLYFAASFIYSNYRSFKRDIELEKTTVSLNNRQKKLLEINSRLAILMRLKRFLKEIKRMLRLVKRSCHENS